MAVSKENCTPEVVGYWNIRDELSVAGDVVLRGSKLVIHKAMRKSTLEKIHEGHLGIEKCRSRAREAIYWPEVNRDVERVVKNCSSCLKYSYKTPVLTLNKTNSSAVIEATKSVFARHGAPDVLITDIITDNGPQYASNEFQVFTEEWRFQHKTSSPHYPRFNGLAEAAVKRLLKTKDGPLVVEIKKEQRLKQTSTYDKDKRDLTAINQGSQVRMYYHEKKLLEVPAKVVQEISPRSYVVQTGEGVKYRRNRLDLKPAPTDQFVELEEPEDDSPQDLEGEVVSSEEQVKLPNDGDVSSSKTVPRRSNRVINKPKRLIEEC
ncbi:uncharacterized protein K02A2.6-like [Actinia tenebrosa]|uniref:Uncharacterized protein K02A2.6-like n=1 Tax=Actinia tenebrosa TaxID=6105 RepID=A0A6P8HYA0_ACTTE|nr:uncharacterized protein K02A2.6-like [Actinia tenebrosa]